MFCLRQCGEPTDARRVGESGLIEVVYLPRRPRDPDRSVAELQP